MLNILMVIILVPISVLLIVGSYYITYSVLKEMWEDFKNK